MGNPVPLSSQFVWAAELLPGVLVALLGKQCLSDDEADTAAKALWLTGYALQASPFQGELPGDLNALTLLHPKVRQLYFWRLVDEWRKQHRNAPSHSWFLFSHGVLIRPGSEDLEWLLGDIRSRTPVQDRQWATRMAIDIWISSGHRRRDRRRIYRAVAGNAELMQIFLDFKKQLRWDQRILFHTAAFVTELLAAGNGTECRVTFNGGGEKFGTGGGFSDTGTCSPREMQLVFLPT